jgi:hypothetical protein
MNKSLATTAVIAIAAVSLSACYPWHHHHHAEVNITDGGGDGWTGHGDQVLTVNQTLDCPTSEGGLTRVSAAGDGKSCVYQRGPDEDVTLSLLSLNGQPLRSALSPMESELNGLVSVSTVNSPVSIQADNSPGHDKAKIDMPGFHIDADGDKAKISILGMKIDADGKNAVVHTGAAGGEATIHAGPGGAEIRAGQVGANSANLVYVLAGDHAGPSGYRAAGYIARGPVAGPLVVGEFKSKAEQKGAHQDHDLERLIDLNVKAG